MLTGIGGAKGEKIIRLIDVRILIGRMRTFLYKTCASLKMRMLSKIYYIIG